MDNILPIHVLSGCATVFSLYGIGKTKLAKNIVKHPELAVNLQVFRNREASKGEISYNRRMIRASLYQGSGRQIFDELRPMWVPLTLLFNLSGNQIHILIYIQ